MVGSHVRLSVAVHDLSMPSGRPGIVHIEGNLFPGTSFRFPFLETGVPRYLPRSSYHVHQEAGSGGLTSTPPQHRKSIPMSAPALWKPKARLAIIRSLLFSPSVRPLVNLVST